MAARLGSPARTGAAFHGNGGAARRYVEANRSRADEYYLGADQAVAEYTVIHANAEVTATRSLSADEYEGWVDWVNPETGESMGIPRKPGAVRKGSPLFAEMTINAPKSLSVAAALHPDVSAALDAAQQDAAQEIQRFLEAEADGAAYLAAIDTEAATSTHLATAGRFGRRKARAEHRTATEQTRNVHAQVREAWKVEPPRNPETLPARAARAAARRAEGDPRVSDADRAVQAAHAEQKTTQKRRQRERLALLVGKFGAEQAPRDQYGMRTINPHRTAVNARTRADLICAEANELRSLPVTDAARRIEANRAQQEQTRQQAAQRARQLDPFEQESRHPSPHRDGPARSL